MIQKEMLIVALAGAQKELHELATRNGFWPDGEPSLDHLGNKIALMHSELSEMLEAIRHGNPRSDHVAEMTLEEEEAADTAIRLFEYCEKRGINLGKAICLKHDYNKTRPFKHGKQF